MESTRRSVFTIGLFVPSSRSADARWTVEARRGDSQESVRLTCGFLFMCSGYYRYDEGYTPDFAGTERFSRLWRASPPSAPAMAGALGAVRAASALG